MLRKSLAKVPFRKAKGEKKPKPDYRWVMLLVFPAWVLVSFLGANLLIFAVFWLLNIAGIDISGIGNETVLQSFSAAVVYLCAFAIAFGVPYLIGRRRVTLETLGLQRLMSWADIGLAPLALIAYLIASTAVIALITSFIPGFQVDQAQDVGFKNITSQSGYLLAFTTLVIIAPIAEETLFRGYLYGKLRNHVPIWAAILATSILFGAVHGQWNVAIDTFVLSIFMCLLREITGSIWAGILLHMIKNAIAFYLLFLVGPMIGA